MSAISTTSSSSTTTNTNTNTTVATTATPSNSNSTSTDMYEIESFVDAIKQNFITVPDDTSAMGIYGYLSEIHTNIIQNATIMAAEYSNEAVPTLAKFEQNVICHALALGISGISAVPASMNVFICIPETNLLANMEQDQFILDCKIPIMVDKFEFHTDFDIVITRDLLPDGTYAYTAMYNMNDLNQITDITSPYLPTIGYITMSGTNLIMINTTIRQVSQGQIYKKITITNPLIDNTVTFTFQDELAYFYVEVNEGGTITDLECVYDGLASTDGSLYCNYMYINSSTIRISFNRNSYQPTSNCDITVNVYTTQGSQGNFTYTQNIIQNLTSNTYSYDNIFMVVKPNGVSQYGADAKTIDQLKAAIPKEALSRGVVTTYTDLNNYFNSINTSDCTLYFLEKVNNQMERLYYSYLLLVDNNNNIIPTNTIDIGLNSNMFQSINPTNFIMQAGAAIYYDGTNPPSGIPNITSDQVSSYDGNGFLYMCPYLIVINKNPFYVAYYLNILNYVRTLTFDYINNNSQLQFIATSITCIRQFFTDRDTYKVTMQMSQNLNLDYGLVTTDDNGNILQCNVSVYGIVYVDGNPYSYVKATITGYDPNQFIYTFEIDFTTNDIINSNGNIDIEGMLQPGTGTSTTAYLPSNIDFRFYILAKFTNGQYGLGDAASIIPNLTGYTLCNTYSILDGGLDLFYDYTTIIDSYVSLVQNVDASYSYTIQKMPLVRYTYITTEAEMTAFMQAVDYRRVWIESCLVYLQDSFGVDFKFFNTYGPAQLFYINNNTLLNRVNLSLTFALQFTMPQYSTITDDITIDIKTYVEQINDINDLFMSNLVTYITNKYRTQLVYFMFVDMNGYGATSQSLYQQNATALAKSTTVPEFINISTKSDGTPDITYNIET